MSFTLPDELEEILSRGDFSTLTPDEYRKLKVWLDVNSRNVFSVTNRQQATEFKKKKKRLQIIFKYCSPTDQTEGKQLVSTGNKKKRGRKGFTDEKRQQYNNICEEWDRASSAGVHKETFVEDNGISMKQLENALSYRRRQKGKDK